MSFEVEGKLIKKYETESKSDKFQAREFVLEVASGNYPEFVKFQLVQDRCAIIDGFAEGERMKVHFDLRGREWQGKYFTNLNAWRVEKVNQSAEAPAASGSDSSFPSASDEPAYSSTSSEDDLPF